MNSGVLFFVGRIRRLPCHPATRLPDGASLIGPTDPSSPPPTQICYLNVNLAIPK
ncbi:hypothetical protein A675_00354 [Salmonella enterica subsp. enterica serovar Enteritidis str. 2009K1726]|nr:hypothetical protein A675_00354 [Salmonella enterica subsp. enterica serovar Enteritidis str. 2009K1726]EPJ05026.1 hypothetical protein A679_00940 [Salmonella enterica subsp. enterica serovar Enteritidis str. 2010K-0284]